MDRQPSKVEGILRWRSRINDQLIILFVEIYPRYFKMEICDTEQRCRGDSAVGWTPECEEQLLGQNVFSDRFYT